MNLKDPFEMVRTETDGPVVSITLNRPEKRNPLDSATVDALRETIADAGRNEVIRAVVISGEGGAFSAGADLAALERMQTASFEENLADSQRLADLFREIYTSPLPIIARVNGHAIAGGCGLAAVCDFSFAVKSAKMGFTEVGIGFVPAIVSVFIRQKISETALRDLLLTGRLITSDEAARVGLITEAVSEEDLNPRVDAVIQQISHGTSRSAVARTKALLAALSGQSLDAALELAARANAEARGTADCRAGVAAFLNKTRPPWAQPR